MRVRDLQEFLSKFTEARKDGSKQGNAISDAFKKWKYTKTHIQYLAYQKIIILIV
jgi:hypothetical protein